MGRRTIKKVAYAAFLCYNYYVTNNKRKNLREKIRRNTKMS